MKRSTLLTTKIAVSRRTQSRAGFTLTELLIVMAILVLLVSLVGPRLLGSKKKADINATKTQIGLFQSALERYAIDTNRFPSTEDSLLALVENTSEETKSSSWDGPYLKKTKLPKDPWGNGYLYEYPSTHSKSDEPDIWSAGPDGEENTEDDIVSWEKSSQEEDGDSELISEPQELISD